MQQIATVCEQSATVFTGEMSVQQFVNRVQQIATSAGSKDRSQTAKNPVVEHKVV